MNTFKYSLITFTQFIIVSAAMGFASFYLAQLDMDSFTCGIFIAVSGVIASILLPFIGTLSDKRHKINITSLVGLVAVIIIALSIPLLFQKKINMLVAAIIYTLIMVAVYISMSLVNSLCMYYSNRGLKINFGLARGVGSVAYTVGSFVVGYFCADGRLESLCIPIAIIIGSVLMLVALLIFNSKVKNLPSEAVSSGAEEEKAAGSVLQFVKKYPVFILLLVGIVFVLSTHNVITNFTFQLCEFLGKGTEESGIVSGICSAAELPTMFLFALLLKKFKASTMIKVSCIFFCIKTLIVGIALASGSITLLYCSAPFQMLGFALFTPASVYYANSIISDKDVVAGQSLLSVTATLGGVIGSLLGGFLLNTIEPVKTIWVMLAVSAVGTVIAFIFAREKKVG